MDVLQQGLLATQINDMNYLTSQHEMGAALFAAGPNELQPDYSSSSLKMEAFDPGMLGTFDETNLQSLEFVDPFSHQPSRIMGDHSLSPVQSLSSPSQYHQFSITDLPTLQQTTTIESCSDNSHPSPTSASSRKGSICDDNTRAERRRAQNRAAQRAYRQRKDQSLKEREKEIESLRNELDKAQRLNQTLWRVVGTLREKIKNPEFAVSTTSISPSASPQEDYFSNRDSTAGLSELATPTLASVAAANGPL